MSLDLCFAFCMIVLTRLLKRINKAHKYCKWRWLRGEVEWSCNGNRSSFNFTSPSAPPHLETSENPKKCCWGFFFIFFYLIIQDLFLLLLLLLCCLQLSVYFQNVFSLSIIYPRPDIAWVLLQIYSCAFILHSQNVTVFLFCLFVCFLSEDSKHLGLKWKLLSCSSNSRA